MREANFDMDFGIIGRSYVQPEDLCFAHFKIGKGGATVAGLRNENKLFYSVTFCSPEDNFSREEGRDFAIYNMKQSKSHLRGVLDISGNEDRKVSYLLEQALYDRINNMRNKPSWLRKESVLSVQYRTRIRKYKYENFHEKLAIWRSRKGFTQKALANKLGCSRGAVSLWEQDRSIPTEENKNKLKKLGFRD